MFVFGLDLWVYLSDIRHLCIFPYAVSFILEGTSQHRLSECVLANSQVTTMSQAPDGDDRKEGMYLLMNVVINVKHRMCCTSRCNAC